MSFEPYPGDGARSDAIHEASPPSTNDPEMKTTSVGPAYDDHIGVEESKDDQINDNSTNGQEIKDEEIDRSRPRLHRLLSKIAKHEQPIGEPDLSELHNLLDEDGLQIDAQDADCRTALHVAAEHGLVHAARKLIAAGANVSAVDKHQQQPLHNACLEGHSEMARLLLEEGANIEARQYYQATPLDNACLKGQIGVVKVLLEKQANTQVTDENGWSPLLSASHYGHTEVVQCLLNVDKSNIDTARTPYGRTALNSAVYHGHAGVVSILRNHGATLNTKDKEGRTPLMTAAEQRHADIMETLLTTRHEGEGIQLETGDNHGFTPLHVACLGGFLKGARMLINAGANCTAQEPKAKITPLIMASNGRYREIVEALLNAEDRTDVNAQTTDGWTALKIASNLNHTKVVEVLLRQANADLPGNDRHIALHLASKQGNGSVAKLLLKAGASVNAITKNNLTALHLASGARDEDKSQLNPDDGPDDLSAKERLNPEFQSGRHGAVVKLLLNNGAKPEAKTTKDETALHLAADRGDPERLGPILKRMTQRDLLTRNKQGRTALYSAFKGDRPEIAMKILLESDELKTAEFGRVDVGNEALEWAAKDSTTHDIAKWLLRKRPRRMEPPQDSESEKWSAIQWVAYEQLPQVLWSLITASDQTAETEGAVKSALELAKKCKNRPQDSVLIQKPQDISKAKLSMIRRQGEKNKGGDKERPDQNVQQTEPGQKGHESEVLQMIKDILQDPPFAQLHKNSKSHELPQPKRNLGGVLETFEAAVVQFHKGEDESCIEP